MADVEKGAARAELREPLAEAADAADAKDAAPASEAVEQAVGGAWSPVCDWPLAFREVHGIFGISKIMDASACVKYNPAYWVLAALLALFLILGKFVHAPADQARKLRADESELERQVRVEWVLLTDGAMFFSALSYLLDIGGYGWHTLLGVIISATFIGGNIAFLRAIRNKYAVGIRTAVVANTIFVVGLTALLVLWIVERFSSHWSVNRWFTFISRVIELAFLCLMVQVYKPLAAQYPLDGKRPGFLEFIGRSLAGLFIVALFILALADHPSGVVVLHATLG